MAFGKDPVGAVATRMPIVCGCLERRLAICVLLLDGLHRVDSLGPKSRNQPGVLVACPPCLAEDLRRSRWSQLFGLQFIEGLWHEREPAR